MNIPTGRPPQMRFSSGVISDSKILSLVACHPFSQQLDLVIPFEGSSSLIDALKKLETRYFRAKVTLSALIDAFSANPRQAVIVTSPSHSEDDLWSVDQRGVLTIAVCKETYERLGLVGKALSFKGHGDVHVIEIPLDPATQSVKNRERVKNALIEWDRRRGTGWNVLVSGDDVEKLSSAFKDLESVSVECKDRMMEAVHVPVPELSKYPEPKGKNTEELEDWNMRTAALFEWVGMASLGAQRLQANDSVDPFIAVYEPPERSKVGHVSHLQWTGFFSTTFVQQILDAVKASSGFSFAAITHQAFTNTAVGFLPPNTTTKVQLQLPRLSGEDTWSLLIDNAISPAHFLLAESWDGLDNR